MLTSDRKKLYIFRNFVVDKTLKKYNAVDFNTFTINSVNGVSDSFNNSFVINSNTNIALGDNDNESFGDWKKVWDGIPFSIQREYSSLMEKRWILFKMKVKSLFFKGRNSPIKYFKTIKENIEELSNIEEKIYFLDKVIEKLVISKQNSMLDSAYLQKSILECEKILKDNGYVRYITEDNLVRFTLKCKKGLRMDYVKEFNRIIPDSVVSNKEAVDDLKVFDNYVILKGSNKLYFVDDWIDEKCDLTYDKIIKELNIDEKIF